MGLDTIGLSIGLSPIGLSHLSGSCRVLKCLPYKYEVIPVMTKEYSKDRPLKVQVAEIMRDRIAADEWKVGESVGDVMKLAERFDVSFGTVRAAEEILVHEGLLHPIRPGIPTRVAAKPSSSDLREVIRMLEDLREQLGTVVTKLEQLTG